MYTTQISAYQASLTVARTSASVRASGDRTFDLLMAIGQKDRAAQAEKPETVELAAAFLEDNGFSDLPAYYDTDLAASIEYGASSLPTTAVVNGEGEIVAISAGMIDPILLRGALDQMV